MSHQQTELELVDNDLAELRHLQSIAKRNGVVTLLSREIEKLEHKRSVLLQLQSHLHESTTACAADKQFLAVSSSEQNLPSVKLHTYAWDQSEKFVKIYVTLSGVEAAPVENIKCDFSAKSLDMNALNIGGKNNQLVVKGLLHAIMPEKSYVKVKKDTVLLMLCKEKSGQHWSCVTEQEQRSKDKKMDSMKSDTKDDPSAGIMNLMKQMYDDGDDDMKRTIKKAWCEAQDKKKGSPGEMDGGEMGF